MPLPILFLQFLYLLEFGEAQDFMLLKKIKKKKVGSGVMPQEYLSYLQ